MDRLLQNNTVVKGVAFLLAFMLWMIVSLDDQPQSPVTQQDGQSTIDNVRIEALYDEHSYAIMDMDIETAQVVLLGKRSLLNINMLRPNYRLFIDLSELGEGTHRVQIQHEGFHPDLRVEIYPRSVRVVIERIEQQEFPVTLEVTGQPEEGYTAESPIIQPQLVTVEAPSSILHEIETITGTVDIDQANETVTQEVSLRALDRNGTEIRTNIEPEKVEVRIPINSPSAIVPLRFRWENEVPDGISVNDLKPIYEQVEVFAPLQVLDDLTEITVPIDLSEINETERISIQLPMEEDWIRIEPETIEIDVDVGSTVERMMRNRPIEVQGLPDQYNIQFINPEGGRVDLEIAGTEERLAQLQENEIRAVIDVSQLNVGNHSVEINYMGLERLFYRLVNPTHQTVDIQILRRQDAEETASQSEQDNSEGE